MWVLLILANRQCSYLLKSDMQMPFFLGFTSLYCRKFIFNLKQWEAFLLAFKMCWYLLNCINFWAKRQKCELYSRKRPPLSINSISVFSIECEIVPYDDDTFNLIVSKVAGMCTFTNSVYIHNTNGGHSVRDEANFCMKHKSNKKRIKENGFDFTIIGQYNWYGWWRWRFQTLDYMLIEHFYRMFT